MEKKARDYLKEGIEVHNQLEKIEDAIIDLKVKLMDVPEDEFISQEEYIKEQCGIDPLINPGKTNKYARPGGMLLILFMAGCVLLSLILSIVMFTSWSNQIAQRNIFSDLKKNPGEGYERWVSGWGNVESFEDLSETWYLVQDDWKLKGVDVTWEDVLETKEKHFKYVTTIHSDPLLERLCNDQREKYDSSNGFVFGVVLDIVALICLIVFIGALKYRIETLREYKAEKQANAEIEHKHAIWTQQVERVKMTWQGLLEEHNKAIEEEKALFKKKTAQVKKKLKKLEEDYDSVEEKTKVIDGIILGIILKKSQYIPNSRKVGEFDYEDPPYTAEALKELLCYMATDDIGEALNLYYEDAMQQREIEARRREEDERIAELRRVERERNRIEEERIRAYERQEIENRRHQEKLAKDARLEAEKRAKDARLEAEKRAKEANEAAEARIRCAKCYLYATCCSYKKNKSPYCSGFKVK